MAARKGYLIRQHFLVFHFPLRKHHRHKQPCNKRDTAVPHQKLVSPTTNTFRKSRENPILHTTPSRIPMAKPISTNPQPVIILWNAPTKAEQKKCTIIIRRNTSHSSITSGTLLNRENICFQGIPAVCRNAAPKIPGEIRVKHSKTKFLTSHATRKYP